MQLTGIQDIHSFSSSNKENRSSSECDNPSSCHTPQVELTQTLFIF